MLRETVNRFIGRTPESQLDDLERTRITLDVLKLREIRLRVHKDHPIEQGMVASNISRLERKHRSMTRKLGPLLRKEEDDAFLISIVEGH